MEKTTFSLLLVLLFLYLFSLPLFSQEMGDVNNDSEINIIDALLIAQYYVGLGPQNFYLDAADVDCDGAISIVDALLIAQYYVGLVTEFAECNVTPSPTPPQGECPIPCLATTVAPELTTVPGITPSASPTPIPIPSYPPPKAGDVDLNGRIFDSIKVCSTVQTDVYANTGYYSSLFSFQVTIYYTPIVMVLDECTGIHGVMSEIDDIELTVDASTSGELVVRGYHAQGMGPNTELQIFTVQFIAVDFGETSDYYGNSYFAYGSFDISVQEFLDTSGEELGDPDGVSYSGIVFYSGDFDPEIQSFPLPYPIR